MGELNEKLEPRKRIIAGRYSESPPSAADGDGVALRAGPTGQLYVIGDGCTIGFSPQAGTGQALTISGTSNRSAPLTIGKRHWIWCKQDVWIIQGSSTVVCTTSDFPFPGGFTAEYIPTSALDQYIAVIQLDQTGTVYIGQAEA